MSTVVQNLTTNMKATIGLLIVYVIAVIIVLVPSPPEFRPLGLGLIAPNIIFIVYCRRRKTWSYAGALVLGVIAILLQVMITVQEGPNPLSGGPPVGVSALYITLPALICLKSYESILELRR